mmetsp:Transcript_4835/g.14808  ORF Transcript_4835/g.14808 Transcript_4835/m.14808 type:complete len:285 (+) Transcript_4835:69-923(+)
MLTDLAPDLLQHVLAQLTSACAVISTARTCSAFNAVAYSDGIWTALAKARFRLVREILIVESENSAHGGYALYRVHTRLSIGCRNLDLYRSCLRPLPADALSTEATTAPEIDEFVFSFELRKGSTLIANASCRYDRIWREEDRCKDSDLGVESGGGCSVDLPLWTALPNVGRSPPGTGWQAGRRSHRATRCRRCFVGRTSAASAGAALMSRRWSCASSSREPVKPRCCMVSASTPMSSSNRRATKSSRARSLLWSSPTRTARPFPTWTTTTWAFPPAQSLSRRP